MSMFRQHKGFSEVLRSRQLNQLRLGLLKCFPGKGSVTFSHAEGSLAEENQSISNICTQCVMYIVLDTQ